MNIATIKEIEEQIDYHLETHDRAAKEGRNDIVINCIEVITSLLDQLNENTITLKTEELKH